MSAHRTTRRPSAHVARIAAIAAVPAALLLSGAAIAGGSYSAFSATTVNPTNNWTAGTVALADDDANTALFTASNLKPGDTGSKCIVVSYTGSLAAANVKLYATAPVTGALSPYLNLKIEQGSSSSTGGNCAGFTAGSTLYNDVATNFSSSSFANGIDTTWAPTASGQAKTFKVTYTVSGSTPNTAQGATTALGFTWEAQSS